MKNPNICKFITAKEQGIITATNFVYESTVPHSGENRVLGENVMYLVSSGEGYFRSAGQVRRISAGHLFFTFADTAFIIENAAGLKYFYISFSGNRSQELFRRFGVTPANSHFVGQEGLIPLWKESLSRASEGNIDLLCESLILYAFSRLERKESNNCDAVEFVLAFIEKHLSDKELSLSAVAQAAGYNPKYLSHLFKKQYGITFSEHLKTVRIKHAVMLIENGVTSVKNVAALSGFADPLYFSKVFREIVGVSPANYRK